MHDPASELRRIPLLKLSERVGGACCVALRSTETLLFGPFWSPYTSRIHGQSVARTPFRTVSLRTRVNRIRLFP